LEDFDIVIVGAGSAGCIVANQFINLTNFKVLLIEAGPSDRNPIINVPLGYGMTFYNKKINWNFYSNKQKNLFNREIYFPRGKVLGGSGSINALVYSRGLKSDYTNWSKNKNWDWQNIKRTFDTIEKNIEIKDNAFPINKIPVNDVSSLHHPMLKNFFNAANELNIPFKKNLTTNSDNQIGHYNINSCNGYRFSSSKAFLRPVISSTRLKLLTKCVVKKLIIKNRKIVALDALYKNKLFKIKPKLGVILCLGSIMTPYVLMHSGIGDGNQLKKFNIPVKLNNMQVGKNLQDHLGIDYLYKSNQKSLNYSLGTWLGRTKSVLQYMYNRKGPFSISINQSGGYIKWKTIKNYPNLQIYFNPLSYSIKHEYKRPLLQADKFNGFAIGFNSCRPKSLGKISLSSPNLYENPVIDPNYLDNEEDINDVKSAIDFLKTISKTKSLKSIIHGPTKIDINKSNEKELIEHFKLNSTSVYHPCGTCRMDSKKEKGVVSENLKVHGSENLWIIDASVFPNITSGNINAPVMMLAHLGSNLVINQLKNNIL